MIENATANNNSNELQEKITISTIVNNSECRTTIIKTPETDFSATDIEFTPTEEKPKPNYEQCIEKAIECNDSTTIHNENKIDFFIDDNIVELSRCSWRGSKNQQKFLKGCLYSPDGTCVLTTINGEGMQIFELPYDLYNIGTISNDRPLDILQNAVHVKEGGTVYDYCWFPFMNSSDPASCW